MNATKRVVVQMANGGLELPGEWQSAQQRERVVKEAKVMLTKVHAACVGDGPVKIYDLVKRKGSNIPGSLSGKRTGRSRQQVFEDGVLEYPFLFRIAGYDVYKLSVDIGRLDDCIERHGRDHVGDLETWGVLWDLKAILRDDFSEPIDQPCSAEYVDDAIVRDTVLPLRETVNIVALDGVADGHADHIQNLLTRHRTHGVRIIDYSSIEVEYYRTFWHP